MGSRIAILIALLLNAGSASSRETFRGSDDWPASTSPPGNLAPGQLPQFILVTFDDGITDFAESFIQPVIGGLRNPDGSRVPVTYFVTKINTDPEIALQRYNDGNELANHTATHTTSDSTFYEEWLWELRETNRFFVNEVGIPSNQIAGFRAPYLQTNDDMWHALQEIGFTYDASLSELVTIPPRVSTGMDALVWPYTLDHGAQTQCLAQACPDGPVPGLWSIPLWASFSPDGTNLGAMDPAVGDDSTFSASLEYMFSMRYRGNRCPLGIYMHAGQIAEPGRQEVLRKFLSEKLKLPDVWMITMRGLIEWMRNPVPVSALSQWFAAGHHRGIGLAASTSPVPALLLQPEDGGLTDQGNTHLSWEVLLSASEYELQVSSDPVFATILLDTSKLARTIIMLPVSLPDGKYNWRVRGVNGHGAGGWSEVRSFHLSQVSSVKEDRSSLPTAPFLEQNYPNPFNPRTVITLYWPATARARLAIYDLLGRLVAVLQDGILPAGVYRQAWDASGMPSGTYICRLEGGGIPGGLVRKLVLLK